MRYGLIGEHLTHSFSKRIHELLAPWPYTLWALAPDELERFIQEEEYDGINVTIPYKKAVMPYLDEVSWEAKRIGSVNTVLRRSGKLCGYNTDYDGFLYMAKKAGISFLGKKVLVLGSGGTSLTARAVLEDGGAREIVTVSRSGEVHYRNLGLHRDADILVNTTPVGMYPHNAGQSVDLADFPHLSGVLDVIYNPLKTNLVLEAEGRGIPTSGGLPMLVRQAVVASGLFFGRNSDDLSSADQVVEVLRHDLQNIVLIGMPGSGKTTVAGELARLTNRARIDTDETIEKEAGQTIPALFRTCGEKAFRSFEKRVVEAAGKVTGAVIATGGGVVLDNENMRALLQNGRIYFIDAPIATLALKGRPLSKDRAEVQKMYEQRKDLYRAYSHTRIPRGDSPSITARAILEDYDETARDQRPQSQLARNP